MKNHFYFMLVNAKKKKKKEKHVNLPIRPQNFTKLYKDKYAYIYVYMYVCIFNKSLNTTSYISI